MKKILLALTIFLFGLTNSSMAQCPTGTDDPPGCVVNCSFWSPGSEPFTQDALNSQPYCSSGELTRWFAVEAVTNNLRITLDSFGCNPNTEISILVFSSSLSPVSVCKTFTNSDIGEFLLTNTIQPNRRYFVRVELNEPVGCPFRLLIEGHQLNVFTGNIELIGDSTFISASAVVLGDLDDVSNIVWSSDNPLVTINTTANFDSITYVKPRFETINLCAELTGSCDILTTCEFIPADENKCSTDFESFPGCDFSCNQYWGLQDTFVADSLNSYFSKWLSLKTQDTIIKVTANQFNCTSGDSIRVSIYDTMQIQISNLVTFNSSNFLTQVVEADKLNVGDEVSILIETTSPLGCNFLLNIEGNDIGMDSIFTEIVPLGGNVFTGITGAKAVPIPGAISYNWETSDSNVTIDFGQGTDSISINNPDELSFELCVTPVFGCETGQQACLLSNFINDIPLPCIPFEGAINSPPTGEAPGCVLCQPVIQFSNEGFVGGLDISCGIPHNSTYQSIIADSTGMLNITFAFNNCQNGDGLQLIIFDFITGEELTCFSNQGALSTTIIVENLTPGNLYVLQVDGFDSDICDYLLAITSGFSQIFPGAVGEIRTDPTSVPLCPKAEVCYEIDEVSGASFYEWLVPGNVTITSGGRLNNTFVCIQLDEPGGGIVSVTPSNSCFAGAPGIVPIVVQPIPPTIWSPIQICQSNFPWDTTVCNVNFSTNNFGAFEIVCSNDLGCDSVIFGTLLPLVQIETVIDTTICAGSCFFINGVCYDQAGDFDIVVPNVQGNGCDSMINLILNVEGNLNLSTDFSFTSPVCQGETIVINYLGTSNPNFIFNWDFGNAQVLSGSGAGPYSLIYNEAGNFPVSLSVSENGCSTLTNTQEITVNEPLLPLSLTCNPTIDEVRFAWVEDANVSDYIFNVVTGQNGFRDGNTYIVPNLSPNETVTLEVTGNSNNGCPSISETQSCETQDCPLTDVVIEPVDDLCFGSGTTVQLIGQSTRNIGTRTWSGPGVDQNGLFNVDIAGVGSHQITFEYREGDCFWTATRIINVDEPLATPVITCAPTVNSIVFSWAPITGADTYQVNVVNGINGVLNGTTFTVEGLSPGTTVDIVVVANGDTACGNSSAAFSCTAIDCPVINLSIPSVSNICLTTNVQPIQLTVDGAPTIGTLQWSGNGVSPNGIFNPQSAGIGNHPITVTYLDVNGVCSVSASTNIVVNQQPTAVFTTDGPICQGQNAQINYVGNASLNANFNWNFAQGTILFGANAGPYEISFTQPGTQTISLLVEENGCTSTVETQIIVIDEELSPIVLQCDNSQLNEITITWNNDVNVSNYDVEVLSSQIGTLSGNSFTVTGLVPDEVVSVSVEGISGNTCPSTIAQISCQTMVCPPLLLTLESISTTFCEGDSVEYQLIALENGIPFTGNIQWSGSNITPDGRFQTQGLAAGSYPVNYSINNGLCSYNFTGQVAIESSPVMSAVVSSPIWQINQFGRIELSAVGGMPPYNFTAADPQTLIDSLLPVGEYCFTVSDQFGCDDEQCYQITPGVYNTKLIHVICAGETIPLSITPSTGASFTWSPATALSCNNCSNPDATPVNSINYQVTAILANGQSESIGVSVIVLPNIICSFNPKIANDFDFNDYNLDTDLHKLTDDLTNHLMKKEVKVVPNPTDGRFKIITNFDFEKALIYDFSGKKVKIITQPNVDLSVLASGVYFVKIEVEGEVVLKKVVVF